MQTPRKQSQTILGKISAQPHPTLCIQFLNRENNDKNNTFPLRKQVYFTIVWGCEETLPKRWYEKTTSEMTARRTLAFVLATRPQKFRLTSEKLNNRKGQAKATRQAKLHKIPQSGRRELNLPSSAEQMTKTRLKSSVLLLMLCY